MTNLILKIVLIFTLFLASQFSAQTGSININVYDDFSKKALSATVAVNSTEQNFQGDGNVSLTNLPVGVYQFQISAEGYAEGLLKDIAVLPNQNLSFSVGLTKMATANIYEVIIAKKAYKSTAESPLSLRNITSEEVQKNAGSNRDISKAILSFPGVGTTATFRNDLFIRGGSSAENKFYIDGIEVPVINHFQTQGASGGPKGILTIDFIKDVDFYSGAFPANRNGALSSLFEFNLKQARKDKIGYKGVIGFDDIQLMADGPLSQDQSWTGLFSARKSNLQFLFKAMGLPFLPSYSDATFKISKKFKSGDELYFLGLGAVDEFKFNENANESLYNQTLIERLPVSPQWNYTIGTGYRHLVENGNWLFTWSRNILDNKSTKYFKNIEIPENLLLDYHSQESENKIRVDRNFRIADYKLSSGANINFSNFTNRSFVKTVTQNGAVTDRTNSDLDLFRYGLYLQGAKKLFDNKMEVSAGFRLDASNYSERTNNPLDQFSPRASLKYLFAERFSFNANAGIYYMLPTYTALGFQQDGNLVNRNTLKYIKNTQVVSGFEFNGKNNLRITLEGYYKKYQNYPFSLRNQISLANLGGDFGVVGTEPLDSRGTGETYGLEVLAQKRTVNDFYGIASYTFGYSKFSDAQGDLLPSSWDSRHILSLTGGKYFKRNWNIGARFRLQSGFPQTPYDIDRSELVNNWNITNGPVSDFSQLNTLRGNLVHQLDVRVEKKWIFNKWQLTFYVDVVNVYGSDNSSALPVIGLYRDADGNGVISNPGAPKDQQIYNLNYEDIKRASPLPYFGFIFEF